MIHRDDRVEGTGVALDLEENRVGRIRPFRRDPQCLAPERTAGPMMSSSSRPNEPLSPLCGFNPQTPMRGFSSPLRLSAVSIS